MVHRAREIGVGKRDPAERCIPQNFSRGRFTASAKEESGLRLRGEEGEFVFDACASYNKRAAQGISAGRPSRPDGKRIEFRIISGEAWLPCRINASIRTGS